MPAHGSLWRLVRPLQEGATAPWLRIYYSLLFDLCRSSENLDAVARTAIDASYETFRADVVAVALQDGESWNVLPYRQHGEMRPPLRLPMQKDPRGPTYEPGQVVDIPDLEAFAREFPALQGVVDIGLRSMVVAAFGYRVHECGYLAFCSAGSQHYSDDEYTLMCLYALAVGIALDRVFD